MAQDIKMNNLGGRPVEFGSAQRQQLLDLLAGGIGNDKACQEVGICRATLYRTLSREPEFRERYDSAKLGAVDALVDAAEDLACQALHAQTGTQVAGIAVTIKFLLWKAGRLVPRRWGKKTSVHVTSIVSHTDTEMAKRLAFLEALGSPSSS
jgi:hypothetical protein